MSIHAESDLFQPVKLGPYTLANRIVMAPLTRSRANKDGAPYEMHAEYYGQRASAGLIISEATQISRQGKGYAYTPGIHSEAQVTGWKKVTDAVHAKGGRIFLQLWHVGRISHPSLQENGAPPVAPSAVKPEGKAFTETGFVPFVTPRALELDELPGVIEQYRVAAENAKAAGFDGVEIHGANGYLLDQFLRDGANKRTDAYGGSIQNRARFPLEVVEAVVDVWGPPRVGYKLSPHFAGYSMSDSNPVETFSYLAEQLNKLQIGYLHIGEAIAGPMAAPAGTVRVTPILREIFNGTVMVNGGYDAQSGNAAITHGEADLIAFGVPFLANPDLPARYRKGATLNPPDQSTFYAGEEKGNVDYPTLKGRQSIQSEIYYAAIL